MLSKWLPWKFLIKRAVQAHGVIDPFMLLARLRRFAQPSEVQEPIELLRAGIIFHARGLVNTKAIQHNLDWVWPYWVERQFNPGDSSFIPRAFSFSHVNLTHRNWTAVGQPEWSLYPIVDPRGLITPYFDGWSIDVWGLDSDGNVLLPSKQDKVDQTLVFKPNLGVVTKACDMGMELTTTVKLEKTDHAPFLQINAQLSGAKADSVVVAIRPFNAEGVQFIEDIVYSENDASCEVDGKWSVCFDPKPKRVVFSSYEEGDVYSKLDSSGTADSQHCSVGMATAAALIPVSSQGENGVRITVPLKQETSLSGHHHSKKKKQVSRDWSSIVGKTADLQVPDKRIQFIYDSAVRTLILLSADDIVPGPYTYRRFWFRDACLMMNAMLALGLEERCRQSLSKFPARQGMNGYFHSQEGEWDSNGQVLWIYDRYEQVTGHFEPGEWLHSLTEAADWIIRKRRRTGRDGLHAGLLPPGFSAEHLGTNDYYYWDDFWGIAGLRSAARLCGKFATAERQKKYAEAAAAFEKDVYKSLSAIPEHRRRNAWPASPYRRMDAGAVGSLVADYPLQLTPAADPAVMDTIEFLMNNCFHEGGFFQDMIHSGINAYLTLDIAQSLLRAGDLRALDLVRTVADLASPTGNWPEAIHPHTKGGCMGDGQHGWAAAEWIMMMRSLFILEDQDRLVFGSGLFPEWLQSGKKLAFGPTSTPWGILSVSFTNRENSLHFHMHADWKTEPPQLQIKVPGYKPQTLAGDEKVVRLERNA